jgi:hypothetical protein
MIAVRMPPICFRSINATARVTVWAPNASVIAAAMMKSAAHRRPNLAEAMNHLRPTHPDLDFRMGFRLRKLDGRPPAAAGSLRRG